MEELLQKEVVLVAAAACGEGNERITAPNALVLASPFLTDVLSCDATDDEKDGSMTLEVHLPLRFKADAVQWVVEHHDGGDDDDDVICIPCLQGYTEIRRVLDYLQLEIPGRFSGELDDEYVCVVLPDNVSKRHLLARHELSFLQDFMQRGNEGWITRHLVLPSHLDQRSCEWVLDSDTCRMHYVHYSYFWDYDTYLSYLLPWDGFFWESDGAALLEVISYFNLRDNTRYRAILVDIKMTQSPWLCVHIMANELVKCGVLSGETWAPLRLHATDRKGPKCGNRLIREWAFFFLADYLLETGETMARKTFLRQLEVNFGHLETPAKLLLNELLEYDFVEELSKGYELSLVDRYPAIPYEMEEAILEEW